MYGCSEHQKEKETKKEKEKEQEDKRVYKINKTSEEKKHTK